MKLTLVRHLWGVDQTNGLDHYLPRWNEVGYSALEASPSSVADWSAFVKFLKRNKFDWIPQVVTNTVSTQVAIHTDTSR
jgi:hypothetical protein